MLHPPCEGDGANATRDPAPSVQRGPPRLPAMLHYTGVKPIRQEVVFNREARCTKHSLPLSGPNNFKETEASHERPGQMCFQPKLCTVRETGADIPQSTDEPMDGGSSPPLLLDRSVALNAANQTCFSSLLPFLASAALYSFICFPFVF